MNELHKILLLSALVGSSLFAEDIAINTIGLNVGTSYSDYSQKNNSGTIILGNTPDKSFTNYELYLTLKNEIYGMKPYISLNYAKNSELEHRYLLVGLNKYYESQNQKYDLYAGLLIGYGELKWKYDPLNSAKSVNVDANKPMIGLQAGLDYVVTKHIAIDLNAKFLAHNYKTQLNPTAGVSATIEHNYTASLALGVSYKF